MSLTQEIVLNKNKSYAFDPSNFSFVAGDVVTFALKSESEFHSFTVASLGIDVEVPDGSTETFTFTLDTPGIYDFVCIPHEALGMVGEITVE
ncbi:plastocyanin/azurin family copper-binding protein [Dehalococcoidia bacterium]|nr:plastocyanin/azurin family copper-binding protein [Dehalococcoidia bacterium]